MADQSRLHFIRGQHDTLDVAVGEGEIPQTGQTVSPLLTLIGQ
ncbi:Uncharacterised protein [Enterobacter cloacae]|nr:Uncharacterised protein [Enterobacter cloacae]